MVLLSVRWVAPGVSLVSLGWKGKRVRVAFVAEDENEDGDEDGRGDGLLGEQDADAIVLCDAVVTPAAVWSNNKLRKNVRVIASEPCAQILALRGVGVPIERSQIHERVPIKAGVSLQPYPSGTSLGACHWLLSVDQVPTLLFVGAPGKAPFSTLPPAPNVIFGVPPVLSADAPLDWTFNHTANVIIPIPDALAPILVPFAREIFVRPSLNALPVWCQKLKGIWDRHGQTWLGGNPKSNLPRFGREAQATLVLESELELLLQAAPQNHVIQRGLEHLFRQLKHSSIEECVHLASSMSKTPRVFCGALWSEHAAVEFSKRLGVNTFRAGMQVTDIIEGEAILDSVIEQAYSALGFSSPDDWFKAQPVHLKDLCIFIKDVGKIEVLGSQSIEMEWDPTREDERTKVERALAVGTPNASVKGHGRKLASFQSYSEETNSLGGDRSKRARFDSHDDD